VSIPFPSKGKEVEGEFINRFHEKVTGRGRHHEKIPAFWIEEGGGIGCTAASGVLASVIEIQRGIMEFLHSASAVPGVRNHQLEWNSAKKHMHVRQLQQELVRVSDHHTDDKK
jgi:hypothetical protein